MYDMNCGRLNLFFMDQHSEDSPGGDEIEIKRHNASMDVLVKFAEKYCPAKSIETSDEIFTSKEISKAIYELSGVQLDLAEIFETMQNMGYKYEAKDGLEYFWLLKKERF